MQERFTLQHVLGEGSQGRVYAAYDAKLAREVAIKIALASDDLCEQHQTFDRFRREQATLSTLSHPSVLTMLDHGTTNSGSPYYTSELLDGVNVEQAIVTHGAAPASVVSQFASRALAALSCVHSAKLVHQDIKPANFFLCRDARVVLLDFGLARLAGEASARDISGTPQFMAPEHLHGCTPQAASDVYSLGATLFFMLTGQQPYEGLVGLDLLTAISCGRKRVCSLERVHPAIACVIDWMTDHDPVERPSIAEASELFFSLQKEQPRAAAMFPAWVNLIGARKQR